MYFIAEGEVHLYQTSSIKTNTIKLDPKNSFGEIEYFRDEKKRLLNAKAMSDKVVCYTLSYEICQKLFPKMIEKEVEELKRQAERVFKRHLEQFNKASETKKKLDGESDSVMNENEASFQVDSRMGGSEAIMRSPESKRNGSNNPPDSAAKLMGEGSVKTINKSSFGN